MGTSSSFFFVFWRPEKKKKMEKFAKDMEKVGMGFQLIDIRLDGESKGEALTRQRKQHVEIFGVPPTKEGFYRQCSYCGKNTLRPVSVKYIDEYMETEDKKGYEKTYPERFKKPAKFKRCSKCKAAYYCEELCQARDWKKHKPFCNRRVKM